MSPLPGPDPRSDEALVAGINAGDESAFEALYYRYRDWVVRLAYRFCGSEADALDVLQDTFAYLLRKFPGFALSARMTTFLYPVIKNLALAARRKQARAGDDYGLDGVPDRYSARQGALDDLAAVLARLSDVHREVLLMRFVDDMSLGQISQALGIPLGTVKSRMHNALQTLREDPQSLEYFRE
jgi:RNA polymerase sigma-70 factor (ECF subfamily)